MMGTTVLRNVDTEFEKNNTRNVCAYRFRTEYLATGQSFVCEMYLLRYCIETIVILVKPLYPHTLKRRKSTFWEPF